MTNKIKLELFCDGWIFNEISSVNISEGCWRVIIIRMITKEEIIESQPSPSYTTALTKLTIPQ